MTDKSSFVRPGEQLSDYDYELPRELIAQQPAQPRDASRLMVIHRHTGTIEHRLFRDVSEYVTPNDCLVLNDTRVMPARLVGRKQTGGAVEILLLRPLADNVWEALAKPSRRLPPGLELRFGPRLRVVMGDFIGDGLRAVHLHPEGDLFSVLQHVGELPLPPYIHEQPTQSGAYETVYARHYGSAAAPTAGLHFTPDVFQALAAKEVPVHYVTLHVGIDTFRPVTAERITDHVMHSESYAIGESTVAGVQQTKARGGKVVAVGTTTCRTLESVAGRQNWQAGSGATDLFIYPGYTFQVVDALLTNFHLPKSSLLMLVSAFAGRELMRTAYAAAVSHEYRFFSFGDAMLII